MRRSIAREGIHLVSISYTSAYIYIPKTVAPSVRPFIKPLYKYAATYSSLLPSSCRSKVPPSPHLILVSPWKRTNREIRLCYKSMIYPLLPPPLHYPLLASVCQVRTSLK